MEAKEFVVVTFPDEENAYGVIPIAWVQDDGTCLYPNCVSEQMKNSLAKSRAVPKEKWLTCQIKILKYYSTFELATQYMDQAEYTSNLESEGELQPENNTKRRRFPKKTLLPGEFDGMSRDEDGESSDDEKCRKKKNVAPPKLSLPVPPTGSHISRLRQDSFSEEDELNSSWRSKNSRSCPTPPPRHQSRESAFSPPTFRGAPYKSAAEEEHFSWTNNTLASCPTPPRHSSYTFSPQVLSGASYRSCAEDESWRSRTPLPSCPTPPPRQLSRESAFSPPTSSGASYKSADIVQLKANNILLWETMSQMKETMDRLESKVDKILQGQTDCNNGKRPDVRPDVINSFARLPATSKEEFDELENQLKNDLAFKQRLVKLCSTLTSRDGRASTSSVLRKLITDDVAEVYSLTGKPHPGAPPKKKFIETESYRLVFEVCVKTHGSECKESAVRQAVSDWLMQAKFRKGRRERKSNQENNANEINFNEDREEAN